MTIFLSAFLLMVQAKVFYCCVLSIERARRRAVAQFTGEPKRKSSLLHYICRHLVGDIFSNYQNWAKHDRPVHICFLAFLGLLRHAGGRDAAFGKITFQDN